MTSASPVELRLIRAVIAELDRQHSDCPDGPFTYMEPEDLDNTDDFEIGIDGRADLLDLVRAISRAGARLADDPPEHGLDVLVQYKTTNGQPVLTCQGPAWYDHARKTWVVNSATTGFTIECWWEYPALLGRQELADMSPAPQEPQEPMPDDTAMYLLRTVHEGRCPKCRELSGYSWGSCQGSCPIPGSPHHSGTETLRQFLRSLGS